MEQTYSKHAKPGQKVLLKGWVNSVRDLGKVKFFILRDREGNIQVTLKAGSVDDKLFEIIKTLDREDCISVAGKVLESRQAPGGKEIIPEKIEIINKSAKPLPLETKEQIQSSPDIRFDYRFFDVRNHKTKAVFRIRHSVMRGVRDFFESTGFVEVATPVIQAAGAEGGATLFPLIYYSSEAFLRQSPQLYKQMLMASGLDRIYEIGPAFRAEKFHTRRHVSEFTSIDTEMSWIENLEDVLKACESLTHHAIKFAIKDAKGYFQILERNIAVPEIPFKRIKYEEAIKILNKEGIEIEFGEDMEDSQEKILGSIMKKKGHEFYLVTHYPSKAKPFYIMMDGEDSRGFDLSNEGMELASGGQREHRYDRLMEVMKSKGLEPNKFKFYLDAFRYGMPPHGGFAIGADRLVQQLAGVENIKDTILFPRTPERLTP
ncbi:MAG: aspartate--tRNA(Asn) ligase [Candidatus Aenigmarchaeota archaeon]|nr:aspartate--tRNA(Asn) ligase [Candidatus Aenigmarchaeota archaeon]